MARAKSYIFNTKSSLTYKNMFGSKKNRLANLAKVQYRIRMMVFASL